MRTQSSKTGMVRTQARIGYSRKSWRRSLKPCVRFLWTCQCLDLEEIVNLTKLQVDECNRRSLSRYGRRDEQRTIEQIVHVTVSPSDGADCEGWQSDPSRTVPERIVEQTVKAIEEIDEIVRLFPEERIQQRTVEQIVVVTVLQVVKEMIRSGPDFSPERIID